MEEGEVGVGRGDEEELEDEENISGEAQEDEENFEDHVSDEEWASSTARLVLRWWTLLPKGTSTRSWLRCVL